MEDLKQKLGLPDTAPEKNGDSTTGIFVSLYLIVLAFFVVLNSISNQVENKVNAATESVTRAFNNEHAPKAEFIDVASTETADSPNDEFYSQIKGLFASLVGFEHKFPTGGGDVIKVYFKKDLLFLPDSADFKKDQEKFFLQLITFLNGGSVNEKREIEFLLYTGNNMPEGPEYWKDLRILRSGAIVHKLTPLGISPDKLSIGLVPGDGTMISITFYNRSLVREEEDNGLPGGFATAEPAAANRNILVSDTGGGR